jgi:potassium-transporting ATPase KdpC subunit
MNNILRPAVLMLLIWSVMTGLIYPLLITGCAQLFFPTQANGSLLLDREGKPRGSSLIGQAFDEPKYFWGRPSATMPYPYNAEASSGSNLGPTNPALVERVQNDVLRYRRTNAESHQSIPVDLVTASGSGLDPHVSVAGVEYQIPRVARARGMHPKALKTLVEQHIEGRQWLLFGEPRVNILKLNLALDGVQ